MKIKTTLRFHLCWNGFHQETKELKMDMGSGENPGWAPYVETFCASSYLKKNTIVCQFLLKYEETIRRFNKSKCLVKPGLQQYIEKL